MPWWTWLLTAFVLGAIELATTTFVLLWIAIAAVVTTLLAWVVPVLWIQGMVFAVVAGGLLWFTRPLARRLRQPRTFTPELEVLRGKTGVVIDAGGPGKLATVRIDGQLWSARTSEPLKPGDTVTVVQAGLAVLEVAPARPNAASRADKGGDEA